MASKFLDRFHGKMRTIPKDGIEVILKDTSTLLPPPRNQPSAISSHPQESHFNRGSMEGRQHHLEPNS